MTLLEKISKIGPPDYNSFTLLEKQQLVEVIHSVELTTNEKFVVTNRLIGMQYKEIAKLMNTTRDPIRAIEAKALRKIRLYLSAEQT
jgi:DNA-directed RNA polymerase sigma subunit (sigma70/sigma32)